MSLVHVALGFLKWILVALILPVLWHGTSCFYGSRHSYHITLGVDVFIISGLLAIGIVRLTATAQSITAATSNPIDSLKYE